MKKLLLAIATHLFPLIFCSAQTFNGDWNGQISIGGQKLTLVFHIRPDTCTLDSPDQGARGIPAMIGLQTNDSIQIKIPTIGAAYNGKKNGETIVGKFMQRGISFPLTLAPGNGERNRPQTPEGPFDYNIKETTFKNNIDGTILAGTLTTPKIITEKTPVVLLVTGSGLQNRDEEIFEHKPFAVIADFLAKRGIASLRYDDRSIGKSTGNATKATTEQFRQDAEAGIHYLRKEEHFKRVGVIGHSEGGIIAYLLGASKNADFIISLAGPTVSGKKLLLEQNRLVLKSQGIPQQTADDYVKVLEQVFDLRIQGTELSNPKKTIQEIIDNCNVTLPPTLQNNLALVLAHDAWTDYFLTLDPTESIKKMKCPAFLLNGDKDIQVPAKLNIPNTLRLRNKKSKTKIYPRLNHLFQHCTTGTINEYREIEETISVEVLEDISNFIQDLTM